LSQRGQARHLGDAARPLPGNRCHLAGWLPLTSADDNWEVNSVGWISGDGRDYLIAVLTTGSATEQAGINLISALAAVVWRAMN
jgi:hypothetical protein